MKKIALFNPLFHDFSFTWLNDRNEEVVLSMKAREITYFEKPQADFMLKHLADEVYNHQDNKTNSEDDYKEIKKFILLDV